MEDKEYIFDKIERYLQGEMNPEERIDFEQELKKDSILQKQYNKHVAANQLLLERRLQKVRAKVAAHKIKSISSRKTLVYGTTALLTLLVVSSVFFFNSNSDSKKETVLTSDSIAVEAFEKPKAEVKKIIIKKDTSAYDTLLKHVQKKDKNPKSQVDVIYENIQEEDKLNVLENLNSEEKVKPDSLIQNKKIKTQNTVENAKAETLENKSESKAISCEDYILHFDVKTKNSCFEKQSGSVTIGVKNQETAPYSYHISNEYNEAVSQSGLGKGSYSVYISDKNACKSSALAFFIEEELCLDDYLINTSYNETFRLKEMKDKYHFKVYDKSGRLYYSQEVKEYEALNWDGKNNQEQITAGYYLIKLEFTDGDIKKGSITIRN